MAAMTIEDLIRAEARLSRAFIGYLFAVGSALAWPMIIAGQIRGEVIPVWVGLASLGLLIVQIALYVWYAIAAGAGAKALGETGWHYVVWILASPFLSMLPIPLVSTVIAVSPLSIKFLLGGQLQTAIREQTTMALHVGA
jgi:hypothetical protein